MNFKFNFLWLLTRFVLELRVNNSLNWQQGRYDTVLCFCHLFLHHPVLINVFFLKWRLWWTKPFVVAWFWNYYSCFWSRALKSFGWMVLTLYMCLISILKLFSSVSVVQLILKNLHYFLKFSIFPLSVCLYYPKAWLPSQI